MNSSTQAQIPRKKTMGRQKIKMQKMVKVANLHVTFSKRRNGLFKKASELCILCAAQVLVIVFSPGKKVYSFFHPDVETIVDRFLNGDNPNTAPNNNNVNQIMEALRDSKIRSLNLELNEVRSLLAKKKSKAQELAKIKKMWQDAGRAPSFEKLNLEQLKFFDKVLSNYENHFNEEVAKFMSLNLNPTTTFNETNATGSSSHFNPNNNLLIPQGLNDVASGFNDTGFCATGGKSSSNNIGEVPFQPEFMNTWAEEYYTMGGKSSANNMGDVPFPPEFIDTWAGEFSKPGACTAQASNVGAIAHQNELNNWGPGFGAGNFAIGETSIAKNVTAVPDQNEFINNWAPSFGNTGTLVTGETTNTNNVGAVSGLPELNNWSTVFDDTEVYATGRTSAEHNFGAQDLVELQLPNDLLTGSYNPKAPSSSTNPYNLMPGDPTNATFLAGSNTGPFRFDDSSSPGQF